MVDHSDLVNTLMTFFTLLYDLTWMIDKTELLFPDLNSGILPIYATIPRADLQASVDAALAAGFSQAAIDLLLGLPQLRDSSHDGAWCLSSTYMNTFIHSFNGEDADQAFWQSSREIYERPDAVGDDKILPGNMLQLTCSNHYGYIMLYDVDTGNVLRVTTLALTDWKQVFFEHGHLLTERKAGKMSQLCCPQKSLHLGSSSIET